MFDPFVTAAGFLVGVVVGLTGMGGGALMTPMLVLIFGVQPLAAVSSDIVASLVMKPIGGGVHWRRGTVHRPLVKWLVVGSVPAAFAGVLILRAVGRGAQLEAWIRMALGVALLVVAAGLILKPLLSSRRSADADEILEVKRLPTVVIGIVGGLVVGMTSVGSGSLMMILLLLLYPGLRLTTLVGTDLVQAVPLVASAAVGHLLFGEFHFDLTMSILLGAVPGVYVGARLSVRARDHVIRPALVVVLIASALKLLGVGLTAVGIVAAVSTAAGIAFGVWAGRRAVAVAVEGSGVPAPLEPKAPPPTPR